MPQLLKNKFIESLLELVEAADAWEIEQEIKRTERKMAAFFRLQGKLFLKELPAIANFFRPVMSEAASDEAELLFEKVAAQTAVEGGKALEKGIATGVQSGYNVLADDLGIGMAWDLSDERAVEYARIHSAEAITKIDSTTKEHIRQTVTYGLEENETYDEVARTITNQFNEFAVGRPQEHIKSRAHLASVTEMGNAREDGGRQLVDEIQAVGIRMEKSRGGPRDDKTSAGCIEDLDAGWIPEDRAFPSGIQHGLRFPGCRHHTNYQVAEPEELRAPEITGLGRMGPVTKGSSYPDTSLGRALRKAETEINRRTTEKCYVFDKNGNVIGSAEGTANRVSITREIRRELFEDSTITHNHPGGGSFSLSDVILLDSSGAAEIRAVDTLYVHSMRITGPLSDELQDIFEEVSLQVRKYLAEAVRAGEMAVAEANATCTHDIWRIVTRKTKKRDVGLSYRRYAREA